MQVKVFKALICLIEQAGTVNKTVKLEQSRRLLQFKKIDYRTPGNHKYWSYYETT